MSHTSKIRILAVLAVFGLVAAACGQKEGVHVGLAGGGGGGQGAPTELATETFVDADADGFDDTTGLAQEEFDQQIAAGGGDVAGGGGFEGGDAGGTGGDPAAGGGGTDGSGQAPAGSPSGGGDDEAGAGGGPGDSTGVSEDTIKIGIHAPLTGAAPLPAESFRRGKDQYWKYEGHTVAGRQVEVIFKDDKYNPSTASQVCQELIQKEKVFLITGSGGTDQIAECARVAAAAGVPYLSAGVTELTLNKLSNYWALSQSYSQQMTPLMQFITKEAKPANGKVGLIASNTANFDDAVAAFKKAAQGAGFEAVVYRPNKQPSESELAALASRMAADGVKVATPVIAPVQWIKLASNPQVRDVNWHGVGITQGLNTVAGAVCQSSQRAVDGATFFSPWPGLNLANQIDPNFRKGGGEDDIEWALWGLNKTLHAAFKKMGTNLTRQAFNQAMTGGVKSGIYPDLNHTASNHFGVDQVHLLRLVCGENQFKSGPNDIFVKRF